VSRTTPEDGARKTLAHAAGDQSATYREVLGNREYRAVFFAGLLSWVGDYFSKAAITALVFAQTHSPALTAAAFAISYLPWLVAGPLLATLAERYPYRNVMVACDIARMALVALVAMPFMPLWGMLVLLLASSIATPPAQAAKSAMMPQILDGDKLPIGVALNITSGQAAQVGGYLVGGLLAAVNPRGALLLDSLTFLLSAILLSTRVRRREPADVTRRNLVRDTADGFRMVFTRPTLRSLALLLFAAMLFSTVPEGLAAAWADSLRPPSEASRGLWQGIIMMAQPVGAALGALLLTRLISPARRRSLMLVFALAVPAALIPALLQPDLLWVALMTLLCGAAVTGVLPTSNALFVRVLPDGYRARAFGVMQMGLQLTQGAGIFAAGLLAEHMALPVAVGVWSSFGLLVMIGIAVSWPSRERFDEALESASVMQQSPGAAAQPVGADRGRVHQKRPQAAPSKRPGTMEA
jgi:MFS family permease